MEIVDETEARGRRPGQITAPAHTLYEIVRKLPEGAEVELSYTGDDPRLRSRRPVQVNLPVLPAGDFPVMSSEGLSAADRDRRRRPERLIDKTRFAISTEETRYYLNGLYLHAVIGGRPDQAARRRHRRPPPGPGRDAGAEGAPGAGRDRAAQDRARGAAPAGRRRRTVSCRSPPAKVRFEFGRAALTSKVIDGSFPDYLRVIPARQHKVMTVDNALFAPAVDRVATISAEKSRSVKMAVETGRSTLTVRNMEAGQAVEELEVDYDGERSRSASTPAICWTSPARSAARRPSSASPTPPRPPWCSIPATPASSTC